jgi:hypothetical protein
MSEWIEHDGESMPVPGETMVLVRHRDGTDEEERDFAPSRADYWLFGTMFNDSSNWSHTDPCDADIVAYKIVS